MPSQGLSGHTITGMVSVICLGAALCCAAQRPIGSVKTEGAEITGTVSVSNGTATIGNNGVVHAGAQNTDVSLTRGGTVRVCGGSQVHLSQSSMAVGRPPLMLALDRGAVEIHTGAEKTDVVLTPDLRFELSGAAPLDLRIRVVPNGDTCVENAGKDAPMLHVTETLGQGAYFLRPGQHVLFEHGSLREVVDHESSNCGCPRPEDAHRGKLTEAARNNPFPEAVSQGLQQPSVPGSPAPQGQVQTQVSSTLNYDGSTGTASGPPGQTTTATETAQASKRPTTPPLATPDEEERKPGFFGSIGQFFRHLFGGH